MKVYVSLPLIARRKDTIPQHFIIMGQNENYFTCLIWFGESIFCKFSGSQDFRKYGDLYMI